MLPTQKKENVVINTGIDPLFLAETLTTDIELTDALFDLIDNSIDAARDKLLLQPDLKYDNYGLPADYSGYEIRLRLSTNTITIKDNCSGFDEETLTNSAFITGKRSNHQFGIGHYGLGLKRALLKAGSNFGLITDNGISRYKAIFTSSSFSGNENSKISAQKYLSKNKPFSLFTVSNLFPDIKYQIHDKAWFEYVIERLGVRYGIFIKKGLKITLINCTLDTPSTHTIRNAIPDIRKGKPLTPFSSRVKTDGLDVYFNIGVHEKYRFSGEQEHTILDNSSISNTYGLYFISNDRVIVDASTDKKHGFSTSWHNEYSGFICLIRMIGNNPGSLPWNTAKTELKLGSSAFIKIKSKIEIVAKEYRSKSKALIKIWKEINNDITIDKELRKIVFAERVGLNLANNTCDTSNTKEKEASKTSAKPKTKEINAKKTAIDAKTIKKRAENNKDKHTQYWATLLPTRFPISDDHEVLDNLIIESIDLLMFSAPYASSMLYRALLETASKRFIKKHNLFKQIKDYYYSRGEGKKKNHSEEYKKSQGIDLNMMVDWLMVQNDIFPVEERNELKIATRKMREHIKILNGIVHGVQLTNDSQLSIIRNDTIILLRFLVS